MFLDGFSRLNADSRSLLSSSSCLMAWSRSSTAFAFSLSMRSRSLSANSRLSCNAWVGFFSSPFGDRLPVKDKTCNYYKEMHYKNLQINWILNAMTDIFGSILWNKRSCCKKKIPVLSMILLSSITMKSIGNHRKLILLQPFDS